MSFAERMAGLRLVAEHYAELQPALMQTPSNRWAVDPYAWSGLVQMSPIESALWFDIRIEGVVMYPQFPVGGFFVDFGNPKAKVAIECDGKQYHIDKAKDAARQAEIESLGWRVYRLSGSACNKPDEYLEDDNGNELLVVGPARNLIRHIAKRHNLSLLAERA
jgi:very-short-patch-repair endonuclease